MYDTKQSEKAKRDYSLSLSLSLFNKQVAKFKVKKKKIQQTEIILSLSFQYANYKIRSKREKS